jgi:polyisoprenoid-binding protein YceI
MTMEKIKFAFLALLLSVTTFAQSTAWKFDPAHTQIRFSVTHMVISEVTGDFKKFDGDVKSNGTDFSNALINFTADVNSINTDNEKRDGHLKSDDFFNADKYPQIKFVGKTMQKVGKNKYKLTGDFTIRDVTKKVTLDVTYTGSASAFGQEKAGFKLSGKINRFDYNLKWNSLLEAGGAVVGKDVEITCNVELVKQAS